MFEEFYRIEIEEREKDCNRNVVLYRIHNFNVNAKTNKNDAPLGYKIIENISMGL